jgi:L-ribulose-5-phosphate 4-epimerase
MEHSIDIAKEQVIRAGKMLVSNGLTARTWGNISARISHDKFVVTPSGLAYETLTQDQVVMVNIADCSYEGNIKPSSEKGIHAEIYKLRPDVNFIIHTHQAMASAISIDGKNIEVQSDAYKYILGDIVPCADYGMSSTKTLRSKVVEVVSKYPESKAVLMKHHGTICMGNSLENSFEIAMCLERLSKEKYENICGAIEKLTVNILDYGRSWRKGSKFVLECNGNINEYCIDGLSEDAIPQAMLHAEIYKSSDVSHIIHITDEEVVAVSRKGQIIRPLLDDFAQIVGVNIKTVKNGLLNFKAVAKELKNKNAVMLANEGALCTGITESDAEAAAMILRKGCAANLYAAAMNITDEIGTVDAYIQRIFYKTKYSKMKK